MDIYVALCKDLLVLRRLSEIYIEDVRVHDWMFSIEELIILCALPPTHIVILHCPPHLIHPLSSSLHFPHTIMWWCGLTMSIIK